MPPTKTKKPVRKPRRKKRSFARRFFRAVITLSIIGFIVGVIGVAGVWIYFSRGLPDVDQLLKYRPPVVSTVYADDGSVIAEFGKERRFVVGLDAVPDLLKKAFISAEDKRFYRHRGVDLIGIVRAALRTAKANANMQGASTIT